MCKTRSRLGDRQAEWVCLCPDIEACGLRQRADGNCGRQGVRTGTPTTRIEIIFRRRCLQPFHQPRRKHMSWRTRDILMGREADLKEMLDLHCCRVRSCHCFALAVLALTRRCVKIRKHNEPLIRTLLCITMPESHIQPKP